MRVSLGFVDSDALGQESDDDGASALVEDVGHRDAEDGSIDAAAADTLEDEGRLLQARQNVSEIVQLVPRVLFPNMLLLISQTVLNRSCVIQDSSDETDVDWIWWNCLWSL